MAATDRDIFIDVGISIAKLLLIASGQGALAAAVGEGAGLLAKLRGTLEIGGKRAVFAEKIADDAAKQLLGEHERISEGDWHVAARQVASLIDQLSEKKRLAAGYNRAELRRTLLALGGTDLRSNLADEPARQAFNWVLEVACQRIADCFTEKEALASLIEKVDEVRAGIQRLADRPAGASQTRAVVVEHAEVVRDLAPDPLEDREREIAELEAFVRGSEKVWYAIEAGVVSGKTGLMSAFALNPPHDAHIVSFFIRRYGGDGNDWRSFAFIAGAQLADILGDEYTERVSEPAVQDVEFRQLLRRAAMACLSAPDSRPLILLVDGINEDSYYEDPDRGDAKSILSLLPSHLPEGVKVISASCSNPRLPEDVRCLEKEERNVVSLRPSPVAEKSIDRNRISIFFRSDVGLDVGAFLAACGGVLTVKELSSLLKIRRCRTISENDVRLCVDRSAGRMLTPVNVGFGGREILAYRLGHKVVERVIIREIEPDFFGEGDDPEEESWWAQVREKALIPYRKEIRRWVKGRVGGVWDKNTPNYVLSEPCFDLMLTDKGGDFLSVQIVLQRGRYEELLRRSGSRSSVLRMIDREYFKVLEMNHGELPEDVLTSLLEVAEFRGHFARTTTYIPGLLKLHVLNFNVTPEVVLDMVLSIDDLECMLCAFKEAISAAMESGCGRAFLPFFPVVFGFLANYQRFRDEVLCLLVDVLIFVGGGAGRNDVDGAEDVDLRDWLHKVLVYMNLGECSSFSLLSLGGVNFLENDMQSTTLFYASAEDAADQIKDPEYRARALVEVAGVVIRVDNVGWARQVAKSAEAAARQIKEFEEFEECEGGLAGAMSLRDLHALVEVVGVLVRVGDVDRARQVAGSAEAAARQIEYPEDRAWALAEVSGALARAGKIDRARQVTESAVSATKQIEESWMRVRVLGEVAAVLTRAGRIEEALDVADQIEDLWLRVRVMVEVADVLVGVSDVGWARQVAKSAEAAAGQIKDPEYRARALAEVAGALVRVDDVGRARQVTEKAVIATKRIKESKYCVWVLVEVAGALVQVGDVDRARQVAKSAEAAAGQIKNPEYRERALAEVAGVLTRANSVCDALKIVKTINEPSRRSYAQSLVIKELVRNGFSDEAVDTLRIVLVEVEGFVRRQDAAHYCTVLAAACLDASDLVDASSPMRERGLA